MKESFKFNSDSKGETKNCEDTMNLYFYKDFCADFIQSTSNGNIHFFIISPSER